MYSLFPITEFWSWRTFVLYMVVSVVVCKCCKSGAKWKKIENINQANSLHYIKNSNLYYAMAFLILVLLGTLRTVDVGSDTYVYIGYFDNAEAFSFQFSKILSFNQMEPFFQIYLKLIHKICNNYTFLFCVNSILVSYAYISYIKEFFDHESDYTFLQIFIFYYVSNMSGMRAALATVFLLISYKKLANGKNIQALIFTLVACGFHYTMIFNVYIIIMTVFFKSEELRKRKWLWIVSLCITLGLAMTSTYLLRGLFASTKYIYYTEKLEYQSLLGSLFFVLFAIFAFYLYKYFMASDEYSPKFKNIFLVSLAFLIAYPVIFVTGAYRIPNYYIMPRLTVWGEMKLYFQSKMKQKAIFHIYVQVVVILYLLFRFTRSSVDGGFIYHWIL